MRRASVGRRGAAEIPPMRIRRARWRAVTVRDWFGFRRVLPSMGKSPSDATPQPRSFRSADALRTWLTKEHARTPALLLRIYKKDSGVASVTYAEALDQALCF